MRERVHIVVSGRVQGVYFRQSTERIARALGLDGWVRNLGDGSVEIIAEGDPQKLVELESWSRIGPPAAHVTRAHAQYVPACNDVQGFHIRYD